MPPHETFDAALANARADEANAKLDAIELMTDDACTLNRVRTLRGRVAQRRKFGMAGMLGENGMMPEIDSLVTAARFYGKRSAQRRAA